MIIADQLTKTYNDVTVLNKDRLDSKRGKFWIGR